MTMPTSSPRNGNGAAPREVSWGLRALDEAVGPLVPGRMYVVGARPSNGKTSLAFSWLDGHVGRVVRAFERPVGEGDFWTLPRRVLAFFTERSPYVSERTWAALRCGYSVDWVLRERWDRLPDGAEAKIAEQLERIAWIEEQGFVQFADVTSPRIGRVIELLEEHEPHVVLFDFVQRVSAERQQTQWEAIGQLSELLQSYASQARAIAMVYSQIKRKGDGVFAKYRPPSEEDFKGSGAIEEDTDVALGVYRQLKRMTLKEEREIKQGHLGLERWIIPEAMAVKVLKHRYLGDAADRLVRVRCRDGRVMDWGEDPPHYAGDAWEQDDEPPLPF